LTEYRTGLPTRIGMPNEHLASGYANELMKPMYATCIGLILRGYDDYESNRLRFISGNTDESTGNSEEVQGSFVNMAQTYELSPEELLKQEFGEDFIPRQETFVSEQQNETPVAELDFQSSDLFNQMPVQQSEMSKENLAEKLQSRTKHIGNIFNTVKSKVIWWFENVEDEKLD
jgi:cell division ATPase FtsA